MLASALVSMVPLTKTLILINYSVGSVLRNAALRAEVLTAGAFPERVQVAIKFVYIGVGAAVASYLREFTSKF